MIGQDLPDSNQRQLLLITSDFTNLKRLSVAAENEWLGGIDIYRAIKFSNLAKTCGQFHRAGFLFLCKWEAIPYT